MLKTIVVFVLLIICFISLITVIFKIAHSYFFNKTRRKFNFKFSKSFRVFIFTFLSIIVITLFSQYNVKTPEISGDLGISELTQVEVNGEIQWISIRGKNINNPIILFLAGGPGGSQLGSVRRNLEQLEEEFVIINWEQPGSGKSFNSVDTESLNVQRYIDDGLALTDYIKDKFNKEKIYIMGESWGSALGIFLVNEQPEDYYAFIGTGQMVAFEETEKICYETALEIAITREDKEQVEKLKKIGLPPYYEENMAFKSAIYLQYLSKEMSNNPKIHNSGYNTLEDLSSPEYGIIDQLNFFRGMLKSFSKVYPELYPIDLRTDFSDLEIPIYIIHGKHDLNAPVHLVEDYYEKLEAPEKKLIIFKNSGHSPWINENELFCQKTIELLIQHRD